MQEETQVSTEAPTGTVVVPNPDTAPAPEQTPVSNPLVDRGQVSDVARDLESHSVEDLPPEPEADAEQPEAQTLEEMVSLEIQQDPNAKWAYLSLQRLLSDKVDAQRAFGKAITEDDTRFIDEAYLREVLGEDADAAIEAATYLHNYAEQHVAKLEQELYSTVEGGEEALKVAALHYAKVAPPEEQGVIAALLDSGDIVKMKYAVRQIMQAGATALPQARAQTFGTPSAQQGISREEFGRTIMQNPNLDDNAYEKLRERLALGLRQGL